MRRHLVKLSLALSAASVIAVAPASPAQAKSCPSGYTHASIGGAEKCLHAGEFCAKGYRVTYRRYGFICGANGRLRED